MGGAQQILHGVLERTKGMVSGVTCGAGMPYKLSEIAAQYGVSYLPIISSGRAFRALWKRAYSKVADLLSAVVYEDPWLAGGHNGLSNAEDPLKPEDPYPRVKALRETMREGGIPDETPIVMAGGVWNLKEWNHWIDNPELGQIAFQFGTRPLLTQESPIPQGWKDRLMTLEEGDILLHRFSPTGFYSSAVRNPFLRHLKARSDRQIPYSREQAGDHTHQLDVAVKGYVGPMRAAFDFAERASIRPDIVSVACELFGSLALTGHGHATDTAILLGLSGYRPETIDPDEIGAIVGGIRHSGKLKLGARIEIGFEESIHLLFRMGEFLPGHANAMRFLATHGDGSTFEATYYSIGGGAILRAGEDAALANATVAHPFSSGFELLEIGDRASLPFGAIVMANELAWRSETETEAFLDDVRGAMLDCIDRGCRNEGILPGGLKVKRRAKCLIEKLQARGPRNDPSTVFEWVSLWALAVNEENAAGGRVVTAPTNGAAGVLPAVLKYYEVLIDTLPDT